jgi:Predicted metal-dependent hydrolase of the TIM-barrel fold
MNIVDFHIHFFSKVSGRNQYGPVYSDFYGRVRNAGETKAFIPPFGNETAFPLPNMRELLQRHGVQKALLLQNPTIGIINEETDRAVSSNRGTYYGVVQVDPFASDAAGIIETYGRKKGFFALKLELSQTWGWLGIHNLKNFSYESLYPLIDVAQSNSLSVIIDIGDHNGQAYSPEGLRNMAEAFADTPFVIEHLGYYTEGTPRTKWEDIVKLGKKDNVFLGISSVAQVMGEEYSCPRALGLIKNAFSVVGAHKLLWGSDAPTTLNRYTYRQMMDMIVLHADFLSSSDKERIMGENAVELFRRVDS